MLQTASPTDLDTRMPHRLLLIVLFLLSGCSAELAPPGPPITSPAVTAEAFVMPDGAGLPPGSGSALQGAPC